MKLKIKSDKSSISKKLDKVPTFIKKKRAEAAEEEEENGTTASADWAVTDIQKVRDQLAVQKANSGANRPPELYFKDGETKRVRFRDNNPIAGIFQYSVMVNGKWQSHTMPSQGEPNYYRDAGLKPSFKTVYEVIDLDGFIDRDGKQRKNLVRFLKVSGRLEEQIDIVRKRRGGLTGFVTEIKRTGSGTKTTYAVYPDDPEPMPAALQKLPRLKPDFRKYYAPLPAQQQKAVIHMLDSDDGETPF